MTKKNTLVAGKIQIFSNEREKSEINIFLNDTANLIG